MHSIRKRALAVFALGVFTEALASTTPESQTLPVVDLGYAIHQGTVNEAAIYYNFSNIRYGDVIRNANRFNAPSPPQSVDRSINKGDRSTRCPQAHPAWLSTGLEVALGEPTSQLTRPSFNVSQIPPRHAEESEDCLFLDVLVPQSAFPQKSTRSVRRRVQHEDSQAPSSEAIPVLVWIDGGGFSAGYKHEMNATGLLQRAQAQAEEGFIFVAMNYRLGLFGFLPANIDGEGSSNVGLLDQRLALEWVQKHIHLFGGDPSRITIMGESAGGGSVLHQITAYGGTRDVPFQKAILQSPGFQPNGNPGFQQALIDETIATATALSNKTIRSINDLRALTYDELSLVNSVIVGRSKYGIYTFGPVVDNSFVPELPSHLIAQGRFANSLQGLLMGTNAREGVLFDSPFLTDDADYRNNIRLFFPNISSTDIENAATVLYPNDLSGKYNYTTQPDRAAITTAEACFHCNTRYLASALPNLLSKNIFKYLFAVPPAIHADDLGYSFYNGNGSTTWEGLPVVEEVAVMLQSYIINFVTSGSPNPENKPSHPQQQQQQHLPHFPPYGTNASVLLLNTTNSGTLQVDAQANERCDWWQKASIG